VLGGPGLTGLFLEFRDHVLLRAGGPIGHDRHHALELLEEIDVEIGAAELAVGDALQAPVLLELDDVADRLVLDRAQLGAADRVLLEMLVARLEQLFRAQEAAYVIGAERWRASV